MECTCEVGSAWDCDEGIHLIDNSKVRAVSPCKCTECKRQLDYEEKHQRDTHIIQYSFGRKLIIYRVCDDCTSIGEILFNGWYYGWMFDAIGDYLSEGEIIPEKCLSSLTPRAREMVCDMIEEEWENEQDDEE
jgi:hypothetical protein